MNQLFIRGFRPSVAIAANRIVEFAGTDEIKQSAAATGKHIGVSSDDGAAATDTSVDVHLYGIARVKLGGTVALGDLLTADAQGRAVVSAGATDRVVGIAMQPGVVDDLGEVLLAPSKNGGAT